MHNIDKNSSSVSSYLSFLQNNISRMHNASFAIKALLLTSVSIILGDSKVNNQIAVLITVVVLLYLMDTYFLWLEKIYREKYNNVVQSLNSNSLNYEDIYDMNPYNLNNSFKQKLFCVLKSFTSFPQLVIYLGIIIIIIIGG